MQIPLSSVEVYKTNVDNKNEAAALAALLLQRFPEATISFDIEDCDRILRVQGSVPANSIIKIMADCGYECVVME